MATYLLTLTLGPVQSLIEAARRTRDLWCGSWLLSESAKAAALVLQNYQSGCLIFPATGLDLQPSEYPKDDDANIANVIRALLEAENEPAVRLLAQQAKQAATDRLAALCQMGRDKLTANNGIELPFHEEIWQAQLLDILECFAAWVEVGQGEHAYQTAAQQLAGLLAARKATRDCLPAAATADSLGAGIPKSSLDGARESVINLPRQLRSQAQYQRSLRKLGLSKGEELDALGIAKRMAGDVEQFTPYTRIAADSWLLLLVQQQPALLAELNHVYAPLVAGDLASKVQGNQDIYAALPYDAQLLYSFRLDNALKLAGDHQFGNLSDQALLDAFQKTLIKIPNELGGPVPYAVVLKADGDRMGVLLGKAQNVAQSSAVSSALHRFAQKVRQLVREYRGHAIYAGGDDVLALLPLEQAVACAQALALAFQQALDGVAAELGLTEAERPTLSVGLGIGHILQPLGQLRARANQAELDAKGDATTQPRNALAIRLGVRAGTEVAYRCRWDDAGSLQFLQQMILAYQQNQCPARLAFELQALAVKLAWTLTAADPCTKVADGTNSIPCLPQIQAAELARTLARKRQTGNDAELNKEMVALLTIQAEKTGLQQLADTLIIARWLSARTAKDIGALQ
jgi:CRISPR-associated protein Cmr2